jgi:hypothetical protein
VRSLRFEYPRKSRKSRKDPLSSKTYLAFSRKHLSVKNTYHFRSLDPCYFEDSARTNFLSFLSPSAFDLESQCQMAEDGSTCPVEGGHIYCLSGLVKAVLDLQISL